MTTMPEATLIADAGAKIAARLDTVRREIDAACRRAGRAPEDVKILAVTKYHDLATVMAALRLGLTDLAENRVQELLTREAAVRELSGDGLKPAAHWHLIGTLQRNKVKYLPGKIESFHALDSLKLARRIQTQFADADRPLPCYIQVNVTGEASKHGFTPEAIRRDYEALTAFPELEICGFMTMARHDADEREQHATFRALKTLGDALWTSTDTAPRYSMGMSADYVAAVEEGATTVRLGSALFGAADHGSGT